MDRWYWWGNHSWRLPAVTGICWQFITISALIILDFSWPPQIRSQHKKTGHWQRRSFGSLQPHWQYCKILYPYKPTFIYNLFPWGKKERTNTDHVHAENLNSARILSPSKQLPNEFTSSVPCHLTLIFDVSKVKHWNQKDSKLMINSRLNALSTVGPQ